MQPNGTLTGIRADGCLGSDSQSGDSKKHGPPVLFPARGEVGMSAAWPIRTSSGSAPTSTCTFLGRIARGGSGWVSRDPHDGVTGQKLASNPVLELGEPRQLR